MTCFRPLEGFKRRDNGGIGWKLNEVWSDIPMTAPCGKCVGCVNTKKRDWAVRMQHEAQMHEQAYFVTMTYNDDHVPNWGTLKMDDGTKFIRAIRKRRPGERISYYLAGEYGSKLRRPHYHAAIYGLRLDDLQLSGSSKKGASGKSPWLEKMWGKGFVTVAPLTPAAAAYVAGYVLKKSTKEEREKELSRHDSATGELRVVAPESARMSCRPAIGRRWIEKFWPEVYGDGKHEGFDFVVLDGQKIKPPLYYDKWLEEHHPEVWKSIDKRRKKNLNRDEYTPERLRVREIVMESKMKQRQTGSSIE